MSTTFHPSQFDLKVSSMCTESDYQVKPSLTVRCVSKAQCLLVLHQCQWSGVLGKDPFDGTQGLSSSSDDSAIPSPHALDCNQKDPLHWGLGNLLWLLTTGLSIRHSWLRVAGDTSTRQQGIRRRSYANKHWSAGNYLMWSENIFSKFFLTVWALALWQGKSSIHLENLHITVRAYW